MRYPSKPKIEKPSAFGVTIPIRNNGNLLLTLKIGFTNIEYMHCSAAISILRQIKPLLIKKYQVSQLGVFGSTARNEALPTSDVDVLVEVDPSIGLRFVDLAMEIESALGLPADVVSRRAIDDARWKAIEPDIAYA